MTFSSYCGQPPEPSELAGAWKFDPIAIGGLFALLVVYLLAVRNDRPALAQRVPFVIAGWTIGMLALFSPLCAWSVSLFSARIGQHLILIFAAAPLLALGRIDRLISAPSPRPMLAATAFALTLWFWHAPAPYAWTFRSDVAYWAMHATLVMSAIWLWHNILHRAPDLSLAAMSAATMMQMSMLGALISLAPSALFAPHFATTIAWGLTPLQDQQLGGALMWVVGGLVFLTLSLIALRRLVEPEPQGN